MNILLNLLGQTDGVHTAGHPKTEYVQHLPCLVSSFPCYGYNNNKAPSSTAQAALLFRPSKGMRVFFVAPLPPISPSHLPRPAPGEHHGGRVGFLMPTPAMVVNRRGEAEVAHFASDTFHVREKQPNTEPQDVPEALK